MLGFKRNAMGVLGIVLITGIHILLIPLLITTPLSGIPIILPFLWYMAAVTFTSAYAAYPVIDKYMIAPYINQTEEETTEEVVEE
jgi:Fe2+ transport system protein B